MSMSHNSTATPIRQRITPPTLCNTCETKNPFPVETKDPKQSTILLRKRPIAGGGHQYRWQCQICGHSVGNAVSQRIVLERWGEPPLFDEGLIETWRQKKESERLDLQLAREEDRGLESEEFRNWYGAYLLTPRWRAKRQAVIRRCKNTCEGCGKFPVSEVHHLTYQHVGNEFLWELVGICEFCHTQAHDEPKTNWREINPYPVGEVAG